MNRIFYILVICCQAFGVSAQSVADAGLFTYSAAGTVTASLGGNGVAWGPDAFAVFRNSAQGALADAKVIAGYAVSSWMPGWDLADRHWIHDAGGLFTFGGRQAVLTGVRYLNLPIVELTDEEGNLQSRFTPYALEVDAGYRSHASRWPTDCPTISSTASWTSWRGCGFRPTTVWRASIHEKTPSAATPCATESPTTSSTSTPTAGAATASSGSAA